MPCIADHPRIRAYSQEQERQESLPLWKLSSLVGRWGAVRRNIKNKKVCWVVISATKKYRVGKGNGRVRGREVQVEI